MTPRLVTEADYCASDVVMAYNTMGCLSALVRQDNGEVRIICPQGHEGTLAMMLYKAADALAEQAPPYTKPERLQ